MNNLPKVVARQCSGRELNPRPIDRKSSTLTTTPPSHQVTPRSSEMTCHYIVLHDPCYINYMIQCQRTMDSQELYLCCWVRQRRTCCTSTWPWSEGSCTRNSYTVAPSHALADQISHRYETQTFTSLNLRFNWLTIIDNIYIYVKSKIHLRFSTRI